jgi:hypothetical protein
MTDTTHTEVAEPTIRPFAEFLVQQANGRTHTELSNALHTVVAAVKETGKAGKVQLTVDVKPMSKSDDRALIVTATCAIKQPQTDAPTSVFFIDADGNLSRTDPRQMTLPLREVEDRRDAKDLKDAK